MKHGIICPVKYLERFATQSNFHLILPHLLENKEYKEFYKKRANHGDFVLMDNSIFELGYSLDKVTLLQLAEEMNVTEVVAPEAWHDQDETERLTEDFIQYCINKRSNVQILSMATGETEEEIIESFFYWNRYPQVSSLGLPFTLDYEIKGVSDNIKSLTLKRVLNRWHLVDNINKYALASNQPIKNTHLMGLSDAVELQRYKGGGYYWVRSNDSSTAFVHGFNGVRYTDKGLPKEKISNKLMFEGYTDELLDEEKIADINFNIQTILSWCE